MDNFNPFGQKGFKNFLKRLVKSIGWQALVVVLGFCLGMGSGILMLVCGILNIIFYPTQIYFVEYLHTLFFNGGCICFAIALLALLSLKKNMAAKRNKTDLIRSFLIDILFPFC